MGYGGGAGGSHPLSPSLTPISASFPQTPLPDLSVYLWSVSGSPKSSPGGPINPPDHPKSSPGTSIGPRLPHPKSSPRNTPQPLAPHESSPGAPHPSWDHPIASTPPPDPFLGSFIPPATTPLGHPVSPKPPLDVSILYESPQILPQGCPIAPRSLQEGGEGAGLGAQDPHPVPPQVRGPHGAGGSRADPDTPLGWRLPGAAAGEGRR